MIGARLHRPGGRRRAAPQRPAASPCWSARATFCCATTPDSPPPSASSWRRTAWNCAAASTSSHRAGLRGRRPCDLVVVAAGFKPNVEIAAEAGVEIGRTGAIRTDDRMETNLRGVYAAGDCAEVTAPGDRPPDLHSAGHHRQQDRTRGRRQCRRRPRALRRHRGHLHRGHLRDGASPPPASPSEQARAEGFSPVAARIEAHSPRRAISRAPRPPWNWWPTAPRAACWAAR